MREPSIENVGLSDPAHLRVQCWTRESPEYPVELLDLAQPPRELYAIGRTAALSRPRVAIVGTRNSTAYGERITRTLTRALVRGGVSIVSGMARGIDACLLYTSPSPRDGLLSRMPS